MCLARHHRLTPTVQPAKLPLVCALALCACAGSRIPPVHQPRDPRFHEVYLLAFAHDGPAYLVLERMDGEPLAIVAFHPETRTRTALGIDPNELSARLAPWPSRQELNARIIAATTDDVVANSGYDWATPIETAEFMGAAVELSGGTVVLHAGDETIPLLDLPEPEGNAVQWLHSPDGRRLGLEARYPGQPAVQALHVIEVAAAVADLWFTQAYEAHRAGDFEESKRLWLKAQGAAPERSEIDYNLACAEALLGHADAAMSHLARALERAPQRFRDPARRDPDLVSLRPREDFRHLIWDPLPESPD